MRRVRMLTPAGTKRFRQYLDALRAGSNDLPPYRLLDNGEDSSALEGSASIDPRQFTDALDAGRYLCERLQSVSVEELNRPGLWNWLSLLLFDQLCPPKANGRREPRADDRYILTSDYRKSYRHLLATPFRLVRLHGDHARVMLTRSLAVHSDLTEQLASRQEIMTNRGIIDAADYLYFDVQRQATKKNASNRAVGGSVRRLIAVSQQLDLTYDLYSMSGEQLITLLPSEFKRWI